MCWIKWSHCLVYQIESKLCVDLVPASHYRTVPHYIAARWTRGDSRQKKKPQKTVYIQKINSICYVCLRLLSPYGEDFFFFAFNQINKHTCTVTFYKSFFSQEKNVTFAIYFQNLRKWIIINVKFSRINRSLVRFT